MTPAGAGADRWVAAEAAPAIDWRAVAAASAASSSARGRHPLAGAGAGDRQRAGDDRPARRLRQVEPGRETGRQRPVEGVAGTDGVDRLDARGVDRASPPPGHQHRAAPRRG